MSELRHTILRACVIAVLISFAPVGYPSSITIETRKDGFATIHNRNHPGNHIGYRFHEHTPITHGDIPADANESGFDPNQAEQLEADFKSAPGVFRYQRLIEQDEHWSRQHWSFYLKPVDDGVELCLVVETFEQGLPAFHGIQQCFRMSGETNAGWRKDVACTPAFSEYDLWDKQGTPKTSLTYVMRAGAWHQLPATSEALGARTPFGLDADTLRTGVPLEDKVGPYEARMLEPIDHALITRTDLKGEWVCGIHWDRASHVTNHHPADCLHAIVNIGGMPAYSKRVILGQIYWFKGTKRDLAERFILDSSKD